MEQKLENLTENVKDMKSLIQAFNKTLENIDQRLSRLEKVDSIEHRVAVNQIDLSDIKEAIERIEGSYNDKLKHLSQRLDSHLVKIAKVEEEIIILKTR